MHIAGFGLCCESYGYLSDSRMAFAGKGGFRRFGLGWVGKVRAAERYD